MPQQPSTRGLDEVEEAHRIVTMQEWYLRVGDGYIKYVNPEDKERVKAEMDGVLSLFRGKLDQLSEFQKGVVYGKMYALSWVLQVPDTDLDEVPQFVEPR